MPEMEPFPEIPNYYSMVHGADEPAQIANIFARLGWSIRKSAWDEYEVETEGAELNCLSSNPVLVNGFVVDVLTNGPRSCERLVAWGFQVEAEAYDDEMHLIKTWKRPEPPNLEPETG